MLLGWACSLVGLCQGTGRPVSAVVGKQGGPSKVRTRPAELALHPWGVPVPCLATAVSTALLRSPHPPFMHLLQIYNSEFVTLWLPRFQKQLPEVRRHSACEHRCGSLQSSRSVQGVSAESLVRTTRQGPQEKVGAVRARKELHGTCFSRVPRRRESSFPSPMHTERPRKCSWSASCGSRAPGSPAVGSSIQAGTGHPGVQQSSPSLSAWHPTPSAGPGVLVEFVGHSHALRVGLPPPRAWLVPG